MQIQVTSTSHLYPENPLTLIKKREGQYHLDFVTDQGKEIILYENLDFGVLLKESETERGTIAANRALDFLSTLYTLQGYEESNYGICISTRELDQFLTDLCPKYITEAVREEYFQKLTHNLTQSEYRGLVRKGKDWAEAKRCLDFCVKQGALRSAVNWISAMKPFIEKDGKSIKEVFDLSFLSSLTKLIDIEKLLIDIEKLFYEKNDTLMQEVLKGNVEIITLSKSNLKLDKICEGLKTFISASKTLLTLKIETSSLEDRFVAKLFSVFKSGKYSIQQITLHSNRLTNHAQSIAHTAMRSHTSLSIDLRSSRFNIGKDELARAAAGLNKIKEVNSQPRNGVESQKKLS